MPYRSSLPRWLFALCACVASAASDSAPVQVRETPARVIRTGLELPDRMATTYAWLDERYLAVTTSPKGDEDTYSGLRRVVAVDSRTGEQKTLLERGFLTCANPHAGVVAAYVGDLRKLLRGGDAPAPVLTWFHWDGPRALLEERPLAKGQTIHTQQCRAFEPEQDSNGQVMTGVAPVRYLEPGHGQIRWSYDYATEKRTDVHWERGGQRRALDVPAEAIAAFVDWMPYRSAYLLSPGVYIDMSGLQRDLPVTTMDPQGRLSRQPLPPEVTKTMKQLSASQAVVAPMRDGLLVMVHGRSAEGGGLYRYSQQGMSRLFCSLPRGTPADLASSEYCFRDEPIQVSPDGCKAAFVTRYDFEGSYPSMSMSGQIHVLDLCTRPAR